MVNLSWVFTIRHVLQLLHEGHLKGEVAVANDHPLVLVHLLHSHLQTVTASHSRVNDSKPSLAQLLLHHVLRVEVLLALLKAPRARAAGGEAKKLLQLHAFFVLPSNLLLFLYSPSLIEVQRMLFLFGELGSDSPC